MDGSLRIRPFRPEEAATSASWRYEPPFDLYNGDPTNAEVFLTMDSDGLGYFAVVDGADELVGFCCFGAEARVSGQSEEPGTLDVGGGVRPDLISRGLATALMPSVLDFGRGRFRPIRFRTAVAAFNERSLRLCRTAGFVEARRFEGPGREFVELLRPS